MATNKKNSEDYERDDHETTLRTGGEWTKRVNVDIPAWAIRELDRESDRRGITRQALIKMWLAERLSKAA